MLDGNLRIECQWDESPGVRVYRNREMVGVADLHPDYVLLNARPLHPMTPEEWAVVKQRTEQWLADNPRPPAAA